MSQTDPEKIAEARSRAAAHQRLEDIETLKKLPAFTRYFARSITEELEKKREAILYDLKLDKDKLWELLLEFRAAHAVAQMLLQDEQGCRNVIGIEADEVP